MYHVDDLMKFMHKSLEGNTDLTQYHQERQSKFLERPDACTTALHTLGVPTSSHQTIMASKEVKPASQAIAAERVSSLQTPNTASIIEVLRPYIPSTTQAASAQPMPPQGLSPGTSHFEKF
jgi:hypothetical protein